MCHTFLASLQQIFQNPLDAFYMPWYFSCKSHRSCGLVQIHLQDVVVFILNTASPWIIPERLTAPQHTRFILPLFHPDKIFRLYCVGGIFFSGKLHLDNRMSRPSMILAFQPTPLHKQGQELRSEQTVIPITWAGAPLLIFCVLTIRKHLLKMRFERSGRGQVSSRGHKFSILENSVFLRDYTSATLVRFRSASCWGVPAPNPAE